MKNIIVGQSGGPTAVINASLAGVFAEADRRGAESIYGMRHGIQGFLEEKIIDMREYVKNSLDVEILKRTPSSFLGSCRYKLPKVEDNEQVYQNIFAILKKLEIDGFFYIGGNDSMDTIMKLSLYGEKIGSHIRFIGIPKTVDNDLAVIDHSPGFASAAKYIATTIKEAVLDAHVYPGSDLTIVEIMGRNTGWLTAAASLARGEDSLGVDAIYLPEATFDIDGFLETAAKISKDRPAVIAISEGIKLADGRYVQDLSGEERSTDSFGHKQLSGSANYLSTLAAHKLGKKCRSIVLSILQRSAAHIASAVDVSEAFALGRAGVDAAIGGENGKVMITTRISNNPYASKIEPIEINKIANIEKLVPKEWIKDVYVTQEYIDYALPLIQGEVSPYFVNGTPRHLTLKR